MQTGTAARMPGAHDHERRQARGRERHDHREGDHAADHHHLAVGEVDELHDAVDHRVAERDDGVHAAEREAVHDLLEEGVHGRCFLRGDRRLRHSTGSRPKKTAPSPVPFSSLPGSLLLLSSSFFGSSFFGSALAGAAARQPGRQRRGRRANGVETPFFTMATGRDLAVLAHAEDGHLGVLAVALGVELDLAGGAREASPCTISGPNLAGSIESAFFIASITAMAPS